MDFITQIKIMEAAKGYSQKDTALQLNITPQNYYRKKKNRTFQVDDLQHIADVLGFDMEIVFTDRESGKKI